MYPNGQYLSQTIDLHFLGRGRHWQILQLWTSVWKPNSQSNEQPDMRSAQNSSPVKNTLSLAKVCNSYSVSKIK